MFFHLVIVSFKNLSERTLANNRLDFESVVYLVVSVDLEIPLLIIKIIFKVYELWSALTQIVDCLETVNLLSLDSCQPTTVSVQASITRYG